LSSWRAAVRAAFVDPVPRDHTEPDARVRRRRMIAVGTLVLGAGALGWSLSIRPGDSLFYVATLAAAVVWIVGGLVSGPLHLGRTPARGELRRPVVFPIATGLALGAVFVLGALIVEQVPPLRDAVNGVLDHARFGSIVVITAVTLLNGVAEEVYFRGALYAAVGRRHPVAITTVIYTLVTLATANVMLVFAAAVVGTVVGLQRRASGGILGPILTHVTWSAVMLFALPPIVGAPV
jgi:uncharacterized protein